MNDKQALIEQLLTSRAPVTISSMAKQLACTDWQAVLALPKDNASIVRDDVTFAQVWQALCAWPRATLFIMHGEHVFEIQAKLTEGKEGMGYYNIFGEGAVTGHLKSDAVAHMALLSVPFMGRESHYVAFFGKDEAVQFCVYVGRENHKLIEAALEGFKSMKREFC